MYKLIKSGVEMFMVIPDGKVQIKAVLKVDRAMLMSGDFQTYIPSAQRLDADTFEVLVNKGKHRTYRKIKLGTVLYKDIYDNFHFCDEPKGKLKKTITITVEAGNINV